MVEAESFLAAILDKPDDDGPRLVYADWLEERGETARAEFIRVQIELARDAIPMEEQFGALRRRESELLRDHRVMWLEPLLLRIEAERPQAPSPMDPVAFTQNIVEMMIYPRGPGAEELGVRPPFSGTAAADAIMAQFARIQHEFQGLRAPVQFGFHRGFVEIAVMSPRDFLAHAATLFALVPLRELQVVMPDVGAGDPAIFESPWLRRLHTLRIRGMLVGDSLTAFLESRHLSELRRLDLSSLRLFPDGMLELPRLGNVPNVEDLNLSTMALLNEGTAALVRNRNWSRLKSLNLSRTGLGDPGLAILAQSPNLRLIESLNVSHNGITPDGLAALIHSPNLPNLLNLDVSANQLSESTFQSVRRWAGALFGNVKVPRWVDELIRSPLANQIRTLNVSKNELDREVVAALRERFGHRLVAQ